MRMQQQERIERFDVVLLEPNGDLDGYVELHGSAQQLAALRKDEEFGRHTIDLQLIVESLRPIDGVTNEGIATEMAAYQEAISQVPQMA